MAAGPPIERDDMTLDEIMRDEEEARLAETRREIAAEKAAWDALTPEERAAQLAKSEAKWERLDLMQAEHDADNEACALCDEFDCDGDCDGDYDGGDE